MRQTEGVAEFMGQHRSQLLHRQVVRIDPYSRRVVSLPEVYSAMPTVGSRENSITTVGEAPVALASVMGTEPAFTHSCAACPRGRRRFGGARRVHHLPVGHR